MRYADPKPKTAGIAGFDGDFPQRSMKSARTQAKASGLEILDLTPPCSNDGSSGGPGNAEGV